MCRWIIAAARECAPPEHHFAARLLFAQVQLYKPHWQAGLRQMEIHSQSPRSQRGSRRSPRLPLTPVTTMAGFATHVGSQTNLYLDICRMPRGTTGNSSKSSRTAARALACHVLSKVPDNKAAGLGRGDWLKAAHAGIMRTSGKPAVYRPESMRAEKRAVTGEARFWPRSPSPL